MEREREGGRDGGREGGTGVQCYTAHDLNTVKSANALLPAHVQNFTARTLYTEKQTDRQTDRQKGRQTDRQVARHTDRQTDRQTVQRVQHGTVF